MKGRTPRWGLAAGAAAVVLVLDQLTKWLASEYLDPGDPVHVVWLLQLNLTSNTGAAFSLGVGGGPIIALAAVLVLVLLASLGRSLRRTGSIVALGVVVGGALGNLTDRLLRADDGFLSGAVVDFIDLQKWPIFNVADMAVVLGAIALVLFGMGEEDTTASGSRQPTDVASDPAPGSTDAGTDPDGI